MSDNDFCPGWAPPHERDCCDAHAGYRQCSSRGPEFGLPDLKGRFDRVLCGHRSGHDGSHAGYGFSLSELVTW